MRLHLKLSPNNRPVPFNYQSSLVGAFHKWIGNNEIHDDVSLYSLSWLQNGRADKGNLDFRYGASFCISAYDSDILKKIIKGIQNDPYLNYGMSVTEVSIQEDPDFSTREYLHLLSPAFVKRHIDNNTKYYFYSDKESEEFLTETLKSKLRKAGLQEKGISVSFDKEYPKAHTKKITYKGIDCKASVCPVIIEGSPEQIKFAWNVGVGNSTGIGFGALK